MRRFSKILAVILCFVVIVGTLAIIASAASTASGNNLKPDNAKSINAADFENKSVGTAYNSQSSSTEFAYGITYAHSYGTVVDAKVKEQTNKDGSEKNRYLSFDRQPLSAVDNTAYWEFRTGDAANKGYNYDTSMTLKDYRYYITDFDLACSRYQYKYDGSTYYGSTVPEGATDVTLAYPVSQLCFIIRSPSFNWVTLMLITDGTDWYISQDSTVSPDTDIKLSNEAGVWNHLSFIAEANYADPSLSAQHIYVNGKYLTSVVMPKDGDIRLAPDAFRITMNSSAIGNVSYDFNLSLDNITTYAYARDYTSGDDVYGLDDYFADPDFKNQSVTACRDLVYNDFYTYIGTPNEPTITIEKPDGSKRGYFMPGPAIETIESGDYLTTSFSVTDYTPKEGLESVTIKCIDGAFVSLSKDASAKYKIQEYLGTYRITLANPSDAITIKWKHPHGGTDLVQTIYPLVAPNSAHFTETEFFIAGENGAPDQVKMITGWKWDIDGANDKYTASELFALTAADFYELKEILKITDNVIEITADTVTKDITYMIYNADGSVFLPNGSYQYYTDTSKIANTINVAPDGSTLKFLHKSSDSDADNVYRLDASVKDLTLVEGRTLNVDLNGFTLIHNNTTADCALFKVSEGSTLNLFSSEEGGKIFQAHAKDNITYGSAGLVSILKGVDKATVNFAKADGTGTFDFNGGTLVYAIGSDKEDDNKKLHNSDAIVVNVYGGNYYSSTRAAYSTFAVLAPDVEININNAQFYFANTTSSYGIFTDYPLNSDAYYTAGHTITAKNSAFIAMSADGATECNIFATAKYINAYFENCTLMGKAFNKNLGANVTLGSNVTLAGNAATEVGKFFKLDDGVLAAVNTLDTFKTSLEISYPKLDLNTLASDKVLSADAMEYQTVAKSAITGARTFQDAANIPENVVAVNFYSPNTNSIFATDYYYVGNTIDVTKHGFDTFAAYNCDNGWYDLAYDKWVNSSEGKEKDYLVAESDIENKFTAEANTPIANVSPSISAEFFDKLGYNFYFAIPGTEVTFDYSANPETGLFIGGVSANDFIAVDSGMYKFSNYLPANDYKSETIAVKFVVNYNETDYALESTFVFDLFDYFAKASTTTECGSSENKLLFAFIEYKLNEYLALDGTAETDLFVQKCNVALYSHGRNCTCRNIDTSGMTFTDEENLITSESYSAIDGMYDDIAYVINDGKIDLVIYTSASSDITAISAVVGTASDAALTKSSVDYNADGVMDVEYRLSDIAITACDDIITFTVSTSAGDVTAKYCLAEEIEINPDATVAKVLYTIATAE